MRKLNGRLITLLILALFIIWRPAPAQATPCCEVWGPVAWLADTVAKSSQTGAELVQWANQAVQWVQQNAYLANIISLFTTLNGLMENHLQTAAAVAVSSGQGQTEASVRAAEGLATSRAQSDSAHTTANVAGERTPPAPQNGQLCNIIVARQAPQALGWFTDLVAGKLTDMISMRYRGQGADGAGPQYAADERNLRCGVTIPNVKTANPIDGYPASCRPDVGEESMIDADISARTIALGEVLQMPPLVSQTTTTPSGTITIKVPVPQLDDDDVLLQKRWVAAMNYCFFAAGPRPSPPVGKDLTSPEGIIETARFDRAQALESAFISQCTHRVAYLSRPYCNDPAMEAVCAVGISACGAARDAGVTLPPGYFCRSGLSQYQAEYLAHQVCMTTQTATSSTGAGYNHGLTMNANSLCTMALARWQARLAREDANLRSALAALQEMRDNYQNAGKTPNKTMRIRAPGAMKPMTPHSMEQVEATDQSPVTKVVVHENASSASYVGVTP